MKNLILILILAVAAFVGVTKAASPSYTSFLSQQFTNDGIKIGLNTNYVLTWQMVNTQDFTTNGNRLAINTNTFASLLIVADMIQKGTNPFIAWTGISTNYLTTNGNQLTINTGALASAIGGGPVSSNSIPVPPPNGALLYNSNGILKGATGMVYSASSGSVGIGVSSPARRLVIDGSSGTLNPQFVMTNTSGAYTWMGTSGNYSEMGAAGVGSDGAYMVANGASESVFQFNTKSNASGSRLIRWINRDNRLTVTLLSDTGASILSSGFVYTNTAPNNTLILGGDGWVRAYGAGAGLNTYQLRIGGDAASGQITNMLVASATLDFPSTSVGAVSDLPITVSGAASGDLVYVGAPATSSTAIAGTFTGFASNGVAFVRFNPSAAAQDPPSGTFKVVVQKF